VGRQAAERARGRGAFLGDLLPLMLGSEHRTGFLEKAIAVHGQALFDYGELPWAELVRSSWTPWNSWFSRASTRWESTRKKGRAWLSSAKKG
jgi:hypothetical protein